MMRKTSGLLLAAALAVFLCGSARADWHHGDINHFHEHDYDHWRGGSWFNGFHEGRTGWWWIVDGSWYFYPAPVYPYPDPYTPPGVVVEEVAPAPVGVAPSYAYYCKNPAGYYPYVPECFGHWRRVVTSTTFLTTPPPQQVIIEQAAPLSPHDADLQQLNVYAADFDKIDLNAPDARKKLNALDKKVETFRQSLFQKDYNAMDILKDSEDMRHRIAEAKARLPKPVPAPAGIAPGTSVTFPPQ